MGPPVLAVGSTSSVGQRLRRNSECSGQSLTGTKRRCSRFVEPCASGPDRALFHWSVRQRRTSYLAHASGREKGSADRSQYDGICTQEDAQLRDETPVRAHAEVVGEAQDARPEVQQHRGITGVLVQKPLQLR